MVRKFAFLLFLFISVQGFGQQLVGYVSLNTTEPYVGQPVEMTVSVYTNTWFTAGVDVGNIQVEGALTVYFRSVPNSRTFGGKRFTGVDFIYHLFPTKAGELTVSPLSIEVESPRPENSKGIKHTITTKEKKLSVKDVPLGVNPNDWLVSSSLNVSQKWNAPLDKVKVGDVLQRTISRSAGGTLSEFIPAVTWDSVPGVSIYPKRPITRTEKTKTYVSAFRSETVNYLFEKEGTITLPKQEFIYWNDRYNKYYKRVIDSITIQVAHNPDLQILSGIKKQLQKEAEAEVAPEQKATLIFGMTWQQFLKLILLVLAVSVVAYYFIRWAYFYIKRKYSAYIGSEKNAYRKVSRSLRAKNGYKFFNEAKLWMLKLDLKESSLDYFIVHHGTEELRENYVVLKKAIFNNSTTLRPNYPELHKELNAARKRFLKKQETLQKHEIRERQKDWLNPISTEE